MMKDMDIDRFVNAPNLLADLCSRVVERLDVKVDARDSISDSAAMDAQLREIAKTIDRLEKLNVPIPDVLRAEKTRLASALSIQDESVQALEALADSLGAIVRDIRVRIQLRKPLVRPPLSQGERVNPERISRSELRASIIQCLRSLGGSSPMKVIFSCMEADLQDKLKPSDLTWLEGTKRYSWQEAARGEREKMIRDGILRGNSPIGVWELTEDHL